MTPRSVRRLVWIGLALSMALYLTQAAVGRARIQDVWMTAIACVLKMAFQLTAAAFSWGNARRFEPDNPSRPAWSNLALSCLLLFLGQLCYAPYQLTLRKAPFPGLADVFFVVYYAFLLLALVAFLRAYTKAGLVPVSPAELKWLTAATTAVVVVLGYAVLKPLVDEPSTGLGHVLNLFYPGFDLLLLVPTVLLFRFSVALRGGHIWPVWLALLAGVICLAAADVAFAYFSNLKMDHLDPLLNALYVASYALLALAALYQRQLLEE